MASTSGASPFPSSESLPPGGLSDNGQRAGGGAQDTIERVKQSAHEAVDRLADKAGPAVERMRSKMSGMSDSMHARGEQLSALQDEWVESCRSTVREHPLATIAVAVAAGVLLAKIFSPPSR